MGALALHIELLGGFAIRFADGRACALPTRKAQALVAYLALPAGRFHSREKLTALLWGDTSEVQARQSFRQALASLRRAAGDEPLLVLTQGDTVALNAARVSVDVATLEASVADGSSEALARAAAILYKGDLLDGFTLAEPAFEEWRVVQRERLREAALEAMARLLRQQLAAEAPEPAIQTALRLLAMDPLQEVVHRALMNLLLRQGRRAAALPQYQVCVAALQRELGAEPEEETRALYREILREAGRATARSPRAAGTLASTASGIGGAEAPMIGRDAELAQLSSAFSQMLDAGGRVLLVSGEAGIGKSRLIQEFAGDAATRGARTLVGRCHETEQMLPLHPWIEALRGDQLTLDPRLRDRLGAATSAELVRVFPELAAAGEQPGAPGAQHALLFDALVELIATEAAGHPMVVVVEDVHWIDAMSARFLAYLGRRIHRLPVLVVATMRPEEMIDVTVPARALAELRSAGQIEEIALHALSEEDTRQLAGYLGVRAGRDVTRILDEIWAASEGNPFVIVESIREMRDRGLDRDRAGVGIARRVQDSVARRLERLGERPRHLVAVAAVIGRDFVFPLLARVGRLGEREAAEAVEELVRRRVLHAVGDRLEFSHDWIRRVAYETLLPTTRTVIHGAVGDALEALHRDRLDDVADQLGHHYSHAGDVRKALPHLVLFAEVAAQRYGLEEAARVFEQALGAVEQLPATERDHARLDVGLRKAVLLSITGRLEEILALLRAHALTWSASRTHSCAPSTTSVSA